MDGLQLVEAIKEQAPTIPVVLTTSQGSEENCRPVAPERCVVLCTQTRFGHLPLSNNQPRSSGWCKKEQHQQAVAKYAIENKVEFSLVTDELLVPSVIARLEEPINELGVFDEGEWMQVAMALDEALVNAMIHGNLEVSSELRQTDDGKPYVDMIKKRKNESPYCQRRVNVQLQASTEQATFIIRDEGPGFDTGSLIDPTDPENLERAGGRGLLLINAFMDEVRHNDAGNEIVMIKRKTPPVQ